MLKMCLSYVGSAAATIKRRMEIRLALDSI